MSFTWDGIQKPIFNILKNDLNLKNLKVSVCDFVDENKNFPYVVLGEGTFVPWDTSTTRGVDANLVVHSWSRARGTKELKSIIFAIYEALHFKEFSTDGFEVVQISEESQEVSTEADGLTSHCVQNFRILIDIKEV